MLLESVVVCGLLLILCGVYRFAYAPYQVLKRHGIRGPRPIPFLGNYGEEAKMTSLKYYEYLYREFGPVVGFYVGQTPQILVADVDMLKQILVKDFNNFMDQPPLPEFLPKGPKALLLTCGETWKKNRQILSPTFSTSKMKMMTPLVKKTISILMEILGENAAIGKSFDFYKLFRLFAMETILATAFGREVNVQRGESDELSRTAYTISRLMGEGQLTSREMVYMIFSNFPWAVPLARFFLVHSSKGDLLKYMNTIALELVEARRSSVNSGRKFKDMLQLMMDATGEEDNEEEAERDSYRNKESKQCQRNPPTLASNRLSSSSSLKLCPSKLTNEQIVAEAVGLLMAGYDTTANALAYTSYLLALNPDVQERLQSEIDSYFEDNPDVSTYEASQEIVFLDNVIQESLRLYPPAPRTFRICLKTTVVKGVTIPQGSTIVVPCSLLQHSPLYWKDPEKFNPDRFTTEERAKRPQLCHIPFGFGPRSCIGTRFALLTIKIALIELLRTYTVVTAPDTEIPLQLVLGVTLSPKNGIYLKVINRNRN